MTQTLVLIGCGDKKASKPRKVKYLYTSDYFQKKRKYAEMVGDEYRILSAEYGVIHPNWVIPPYDTHIDEVDEDVWAKHVTEALEDLEFDELIVLAGEDYVSPVDETLERYNAIRPFSNTEGIGEQGSWLTNQLKQLNKERHESALDW